MIEQQCWIEINQEFLVVEFSLQMFMCLFGYWGEVIYNWFDYLGYQQYYCCGFYCQLKNVFQVVICQCVNYQFYDEVNGNWFIEGVEVFLNVIGVKVNMVKIGDFVDDGIYEDGNWF